MIFTHIISGSKLFHRQVCLQIVIDILKKAGNLLVVGIGLLVINILFFQKNPVEIYHKFLK